jgi:hypothetical protein
MISSAIPTTIRQLFASVLLISPIRAEVLNGVQFTHAVAYCYDSYQDPRGVSIIFEHGSLHHGVIRKFTTRLDAEAIRGLMSAVGTEHAAKRSLGYNDASHAIVLYDTQWNHVGWIVCDLNEGRILCHPKDLVTHFNPDRFKDVITRTGIPILESKQAYRRHFEVEGGGVRFEGEDPAMRPYLTVLRPVEVVPEGLDASMLSTDISYGYSSENPIVLAKDANRAGIEIVEDFLRKISCTAIGNPISFYRSPRKLDDSDMYCYQSTAWIDATIELWIRLSPEIESPAKAPSGLLLLPDKRPIGRPNLHEANPKAQQAGSGQPATRPESKSAGDDNPEPDAEGRSR